jgi:LPXTG-motif cell wall-anchored protein
VRGTRWALVGGYALVVALVGPAALSAAQDGEAEAPATSSGAVTAPAASAESDTIEATSSAKQSAHEVLMRDIEFVPKTITVDVGDTITWRNEDSEPHNAIANDNSIFSTETIQQGETVSATIDQAGTIPYFCSIHAGMKGTVRAVGGGSGGGGSGGGGSGGGSGGAGSPGGSSDDFLDPSATPPAGSGSSTGSSSSAGSDSSLPTTGQDSVWLALAGAWLLAVGATIRAALSGSRV